MNSLRRIFSLGRIRPARRHPISEPTEAEGRHAGTIVQQFIDLARKEGWNPIASIRLHCVECGAAVSLVEGGPLSDEPYEFIHSEDHYEGDCDSLKQPLVCQKCSGEMFRVSIQPTGFKEWLREALASLRTTDQDPAEGFREDETGTLFEDPLLKRVSTFDELWTSIKSYVDPLGGINGRYEYNITFDGQGRVRRLDRRVPALRHVNHRARLASSNRAVKVLITVLKCKGDQYWYSVEWD